MELSPETCETREDQVLAGLICDGMERGLSLAHSIRLAQHHWWQWSVAANDAAVEKANAAIASCQEQ